MFHSPPNNGLNIFHPPMAQGQLGFGGPFQPMQPPFAVPQPANFRPPFLGQLAGHPVGFPPPAFNGGQFGGPAPVGVFSPTPLPQANFQPQPEMMMINGLVAHRVYPQGAPQVQADLGYQQPNVSPAVQQPSYLPQLIPNGQQAQASSPVPQTSYLPQPIPNGQQAQASSSVPVPQSPRSSPNPGAQARGAPQQSPSYLLSSMHDDHSSFYGSNTPSSLVSDETQRKNLYSISYFSSSDPLAQNASPQIASKPSETSRIFYEYRSASASGGGVSPADFIANYYGNGDSNSVGSPLVKICKMELAETITIGNCVINGRRNYIDINEGGNKTRIHIDNDGARDLEKYRILVRGELEKLKNNIDFNSLNKSGFKDLKNVADINNFFTQQPTGVQVTNDDRTLDAIADTFISNNLKAGRFKTEIPNGQNGFEDKPFAYVKIERPKGDDKKINVTVSDKYSAELNSININAGKNNNNEEVFFQLSVEAKDEKQVIKQDSLKYFTKNKDGTFKEEALKEGELWGFKNIDKLGDAKDKIINIFTHEVKKRDYMWSLETEKNELTCNITKGKIYPKFNKFVPKKKCGELNDFTDHEFMNVQSRSASPQAGARGGPQSPDHVAGGGMAVGQSVVSTPMPMSPQPAMGAQLPMVAPMSPQPAPFQGGPPPAPVPMMGQMMMGGVRQAPIYAGSPPPPMQILQPIQYQAQGGAPMGPPQMMGAQLPMVAPMSPQPAPFQGGAPIFQQPAQFLGVAPMGVPVQMRAPMVAPGQMPMMGGGQFPVVQQVPMMGGGMPVQAIARPPIVMMQAPQTIVQPFRGVQPLQQMNAWQGPVLYR